MRNVSDKSCTENQNTNFIFNNCFFFFFPAVYEMWKNIVEPGRPQMTVWRMRIERCIPNATDTHSEYVLLIAFPLQRDLHERGSMLRCSIRTLLVLLQWRMRVSIL
jgi:hypothetical protein